MIILEHGETKAAVVYCIYWVDGKRMVCAILENENDRSFLRENEYEMIDPVLSEPFIIRKSSCDHDLFLHWAVDKDDLLDDIINHEPGAFQEFRKRLEESPYPNKEKQVQQGINQILLKEWDPLGLSAANEPDSEYVPFAKHIFNQFLVYKDRERIIDYLGAIETEHYGFGRPDGDKLSACVDSIEALMKEQYPYRFKDDSST